MTKVASAAQAIVDSLIRHGVDTIFGIPGVHTYRLFDALYGGTENFVAWQKRENGRLLDIYTDHGGTKDESEKLMAFYRTNGVSFFAAEGANAVSENLQTNRLVFLHSDMTHNDVFARRETFEQFLKTSGLPNQ